MQKQSFMLLLLLAAMTALAAYLSFLPITATQGFIRFFGLGGFVLLCAALIIGPLATINTKYASLIEPRRAVGLASFVFMAAHVLLASAIYFQWNIISMFAFPQLVVAMPAAIIVTLIALVSSDYMLRVMGEPLWKNVQRLTYAAFVFIFAHFLLQATGLFEGRQEGTAFSNLAEIGVLLLGIATVLLQLYGFYLKRKRRQQALPT